MTGLHPLFLKYFTPFMACCTLLSMQACITQPHAVSTNRPADLSKNYRSGPKKVIAHKVAAKDISRLEKEVFAKINAYRTKQGLARLIWHDQVARVSRQHSSHMAKETAPINHDGFPQRVDTLKTRLELAKAAENVGYSLGHADPAGRLVEGWLQSPGHHGNIQGDFKYSGIGMAVDRSGGLYATQIFVK